MSKEQNETVQSLTEQDMKISENLEGLHRILLGLNAYGSLDLIDYKLITNYLSQSFDYKFIDDNK